MFYLYKISKRLYLQVILIYNNKPYNINKNQLFDFKIHKLEKYYSDTNFTTQLPNTKIINNSSIIIIDLIRNTKRKDYKSLIYADSAISRKMIFDIAKIINSYGFYIASHTGDGFVFIYENNSNKELLLKNVKSILFELERYLMDCNSFLNTVNNLILNHRLRILVDNVETIFEMNDTDSMSKKLYFSSDLDKCFDKMKITTKHDEKHLLILDDFYKNIDWISQSFEIRKIKCPIEN